MSNDPLPRLVREINARFERIEKGMQQFANRINANDRNAQVEASMMNHDRAVQAWDKLLTHQTYYANTILLLGYGGFFALWAVCAGKMTKPWFGVSGFLMGVSILAFVLFELAKVFGLSMVAQRIGTRGEDGRPFTEADALEASSEMEQKINRWWLPAFLLSAATGLASGIMVLSFFIDHSLRTDWAPLRRAAGTPAASVTSDTPRPSPAAPSRRQLSPHREEQTKPATDGPPK